jgi:predicted dehydrogenase
MRFIIIGAGFMGHNHARVIANNPKAELVGIIDIDRPAAESLAALYDTQACNSVTFAPKADAVIIASPTMHHHAHAYDCMKKGLHVLVEKPIAESVAKARSLVDLAKRTGLTLATGHVERHNPAFQQAAALTSKPVFITADRLSPHPQRIKDGVILDMMIHDIDIVMAIMKDHEIDDVSARKTYGLSNTEDIAVAALSFDNGTIVSLTASRLSQGKTRQLEIVELDRTISVDLLRQNVSVYSAGKTELANGLQQTGLLEIPYATISGGEPLAIQLEDFIQAIQHQRQPMVTGEHGLQALKVCKEIDRACTI